MIDLMPSIDYKIHSSVSGDCEDCITEINGELSVFNDDEDEYELAGKFRHFLIHVEDSGYSADYLLDVRSKIYPFTCLFEAGTFSFSEKFMSVMENEMWSSNILILDRIEILPGFQGHSLTKVIIDDAVKLFSARTNVVVLKAFPLQHECRLPDRTPDEWEVAMAYNDLEQDSGKATKQLVSFYESLGFAVVEDDGIMAKLID